MKSFLKFALVAAMAGLMAGCGPQGNKNNQNQSQTGAMQNQTMGRHHGGRLRRICANDIQKYCLTGKRIRRCLHEVSDRLEPACKAAVDKAVERRRERKLEREQKNNQSQPANGATPQAPTTPQNQMAPQNNQHPDSSNDDDDDDN